MKKTLAITGAQAAAESMRQINPEVFAAYPITPQTPIIENFAKIVANKQVDTEFIPVESEHSALSACVGASAAGVRAITATSSVGLALMWEVLGVASGLRLPIVMHIACRALSAPLNIHGDHSDAMGARDQGWIQIFAKNNQEVYELALLSQRLAEKTLLPVMLCQDGFTTSHGVEKTEILSDQEATKFIGQYKPDRPLLDVDNPTTYGPVALPDYFTEIKKLQYQAFDQVKSSYLAIGQELSKLTKNNYPLFEQYNLDKAEAVIVLFSATASTAEQAVNELKQEGKNVGILRPILYRPFPYQEMAKILSKFKKIAVLDRAISFGAEPPLYSDIKLSLNNSNIKIQSYIFGLGGHDTTVNDIKKVFNDLLQDKFSNGSKFLY